LIYIQSKSMKGGARQGAGRKKGSGQAAQYRAMLEPHAEELIQQVVDRAKDGDMAALKLCFDRLCAPLRPTDRLITIEGMSDAKELSDKGELILTNVANGEITPSEAQSLMAAISSQARIIEVDELERRVAELEQGIETR
jgi:polyhydroxyalkanoate synthesis regulator phasin